MKQRLSYLFHYFFVIFVFYALYFCYFFIMIFIYFLLFSYFYLFSYIFYFLSYLVTPKNETIITPNYKPGNDFNDQL